MVVYQNDPTHLLIFDRRGVTQVDITLGYRRIEEVLSYSTWILVDLNQNQVDPHPVTQKLGRFMIQVASPSLLRSYWCEKVRVCFNRYVMRPMSLEETEQWCVQICNVFCYSYSISDLPTRSWYCMKNATGTVEEALDFYARYGPSALGTLFSSSEDWECEVTDALRLLGENISSSINVNWELKWAIDQHLVLLSKILLLTPRRERYLFRLEVITDHVYHSMLEWASEARGSEQRFNPVKLRSSLINFGRPGAGALD